LILKELRMRRVLERDELGWRKKIVRTGCRHGA
jgi:hypothetical protein